MGMQSIFRERRDPGLRPPYVPSISASRRFMFANTARDVGAVDVEALVRPGSDAKRTLRLLGRRVFDNAQLPRLSMPRTSVEGVFQCASTGAGRPEALSIERKRVACAFLECLRVPALLFLGGYRTKVRISSGAAPSRIAHEPRQAVRHRR